MNFRNITGLILILVVTHSKSTLIGMIKTRLAYKSDIELMCVQNVSVKFYTRNARNQVQQIVYDNKKYFFNASRNILTIKSLKKSDITTNYFCNSSTGIEIHFHSQIEPYLNETDIEPQEVTEDSPYAINCYIVVGNENNQSINWSWKFKNQTIKEKACTANIVSNNTQSSLIFSETPLLGNGLYECTATNQYGSFTRTVNLRVRSKLSMLWPFVAVLFLVFIFTIVLFIYQIKKHKVLTQVAKI